MALSFNKKVYIAASIIATATVVISAYCFSSGAFSSVSDKLTKSYTPVATKSEVKTEISKTNSKIKADDNGVPIFSEYYARTNYEKRKAAAEDLENFLQHAKFKDDNLAVLNRKLIQIGIEVQKDGSVIVLPTERWRALYMTLKPSEIVHVRKDTPYIKEGTEDADIYTGKVVRLSPRKAPTITVEDKTQEEEEEEYYDEELPDPVNAYEDRVNRRAIAVKNYLYSTFSKAINHKRHGLRNTVVNTYIDDTFQHYKHKAQEK